MVGAIEKNELLRRRGFSEEEIANNLSNYVGAKSWLIKTVSVEEVRQSYDLEVLNRLFAKDSIPNYKFANLGVYGFNFFAENPIAFNVPAAELDPYIAAFARAVNLCGAFTCMSCDGWHKNQDPGSERDKKYYQHYREMKLWFPERYSVLWLWIIIEYVFGEDWRHNSERYESASWWDQWEPIREDDEVNYAHSIGEFLDRNMMVYRISRGNEKAAYSKTYSYAKYLMEHRNEILAIRERVIERLKEHDDIESINFMALRREMLNVCENDLRELKTQIGNGL